MSWTYITGLDGERYLSDPVTTLQPNQKIKSFFPRSIPNMDDNGLIWPKQGTTNTAMAAAVTSNTSYFQYLGRATKDYVQARIFCNITGAGAGTVTYNEVGIFKYAGAFGASPVAFTAGTMVALTRVATASIATVTTGVKNTVVTLTGILPGDDLFAVISCQNATTQPTFTGTLADLMSTGVAATQATYRPSTGTSPVTPTISAAAIPLLVVQLT